MNYDDMFSFVEKKLKENNGNDSYKEHQTFRKRIEHIKRVYKWAEIISEGLDVNMVALKMAVIFHDSGYAYQKHGHAQRGKEIFLEYAKEKNYPKELVDYVGYLILNHSDKSLLNSDSPIELILLLEADLLDEEGALKILWDAMCIGDKGANSYLDGYNEIISFSGRILNQSPMVTEKSKKIWEEKNAL